MGRHRSRSHLAGRGGRPRWLLAAAVCLVALAAPAVASAQQAAPGQVIFPSPANGATVASPVEIVYHHNPACEEIVFGHDQPLGQNMAPPQVVNVATGKNEMELSPGLSRKLVASPSQVGLDSMYVTAGEYGGPSPYPRQGIQRTERIVMGLPDGTYEVKFTVFIPCAGTSDVLRFTVGAAPAGGGSAPAAPSVPRTLMDALAVLNDPNASPEARAAAERIVDSASGRTEDFTAEVVLSLWPTGKLTAAILKAFPWLTRFGDPFGPQLRSLLRKYLPQIRAGSTAALAAFQREARKRLVGWALQAGESLPPALRKRFFSEATRRELLRAGVRESNGAKLAGDLASHRTGAARSDRALWPKAVTQGGATGKQALAKGVADQILSHPQRLVTPVTKNGEIVGYNVTLPPGKGFDATGRKIIDVAEHRGVPFTGDNFKRGIGVRVDRNGGFQFFADSTPRPGKVSAKTSG